MHAFYRQKLIYCITKSLRSFFTSPDHLCHTGGLFMDHAFHAEAATFLVCIYFCSENVCDHLKVKLIAWCVVLGEQVLASLLRDEMITTPLPAPIEKLYRVEGNRQEKD